LLRKSGAGDLPNELALYLSIRFVRLKRELLPLPWGHPDNAETERREHLVTSHGEFERFLTMRNAASGGPLRQATVLNPHMVS
jgi:hypothetical protein